jgi:hypothetical protein
MKKARKHKTDDPSPATLEAIPERSFRNAVRGKYAARYAETVVSPSPTRKTAKRTGTRSR